jgi:hypothetical protein
VQPVGDSFSGPDGERFAGEDQKGRLKGILGVVVIADNSPAHAEDHRAMAPSQGRKGRFVVLVDERRQQLGVRFARIVLL